MSLYFGGIDGPQIRHVLNHTAGFPAWVPYYLSEEARTTDEMRRNRESILHAIVESSRKPAGDEYLYTDLGYILLGRLVEKLFDLDLDSAMQAEIFDPLELTQTRFVNLLKDESPLEDAAATEFCPVRGVGAPPVKSTCDAFAEVQEKIRPPFPVIGVVHDENCWIQGGVCGHAGLFSTADDLLNFGAHLVAIDQGSSGIVKDRSLKTFWSRIHRHPQGHHLLGWDSPSGERTSVGRGFSFEQSVGHLGFVGSSLWIDRSCQTVAVLLSNRVYPTRQHSRAIDLRIDFHEAVIPPEN